MLGSGDVCCPLKRRLKLTELFIKIGFERYILRRPWELS